MKPIIRHTSPLITSSSSPLLSSLSHPSRSQIRHATFIPRPRRPYTFTQLVALSDGSTYLHRTSSPAPVYKSAKDTRNTQLWNPSSQRLMNIEADEAGRLRAFRSRFGRGWDTKRGKEIEVDAEGVEVGESIETVEIIKPAAEDGVEAKDGEAEVVESIEVKSDDGRKELVDEEDVGQDNLLDLIANPEGGFQELGPKEKKIKRRGRGKK